MLPAIITRNLSTTTKQALIQGLSIANSKKSQLLDPSLFQVMDKNIPQKRFIQGLIQKDFTTHEVSQVVKLWRGMISANRAELRDNQYQIFSLGSLSQQEKELLQPEIAAQQCLFRSFPGAAAVNQVKKQQGWNGTLQTHLSNWKDRELLLIKRLAELSWDRWQGREAGLEVHEVSKKISTSAHLNLARVLSVLMDRTVSLYVQGKSIHSLREALADAAVHSGLLVSQSRSVQEMAAHYHQNRYRVIVLVDNYQHILGRRDPDGVSLKQDIEALMGDSQISILRCIHPK
jgi:hypothetical protein